MRQCRQQRGRDDAGRSEEHTSELQSQSNLVCRLLLEKKKNHLTNRSTQNTSEQATYTALRGAIHSQKRSETQSGTMPLRVVSEILRHRSACVCAMSPD